MSTTLVIGLPGTGKTTYVKEHRGNALVYDLDYIKAALTYSDVHSHDDIAARKVADSFLAFFATYAPLYDGRNLYIIRTAPKLEEFAALKPDKLVVMTKEYDISGRGDYHDDVDKELYNARITACIKWCDKNGVDVEFKE